MGDLISRSAVLNFIKEEVKQDRPEDFKIRNTQRFIEDIPTAYNVDAVVAEIQKAYCKKCRNILGVAGAEAYCKEQKCDIYAVYDIVRKGGVE